MSLAVTGGYQCGQVRYAIATPPTVVYYCHCRECQQQSASAFGMSVRTATPYQATIKGSSLDDTSQLTPSAHIWVSRKQPWVALDPELPAHPTQPDDLDAWRKGVET